MKPNNGTLQRALKPETVTRIRNESIVKHFETLQSLYERCIEAAYNNRHNPTGRDYLERAKKTKNKLILARHEVEKLEDIKAHK